MFRIRIRDIDCDYRLIRRALLDRIQLTSTSGTICVELVRKLELSGCEVAEIGVHHYPRLHGRSQFFRLRSLAVTFVQLLRLWVRLVIFRMSIPMVDLRPLLAETEPAWRAHLARLFERMQFILGEQVAAFERGIRRRPGARALRWASARAPPPSNWPCAPPAWPTAARRSSCPR